MTTTRIAMWSGPRNVSSALMYSFAARGDCAVWDEPFYAAYLDATGLDHPMRDDILAAHESDPDHVASACRGPVPGGWPVFYQKHMAQHMIPGFPRAWMRSCRNVFLIRHPARVVASYAARRQGAEPEDLGFTLIEELFDEVAQWSGEAPAVLDGDALRADPETSLRRLCDRLGLAFTPRMLRWPAGPKPFDGVWAPHWYAAVHRSTGFEAPDAPLPPLGGRYAALAEAGMPSYERLLAQAL